MCTKTTRVGRADSEGLSGIRAEISLDEAGSGNRWEGMGRHGVCSRVRGKSRHLKKDASAVSLS